MSLNVNTTPFVAASPFDIDTTYDVANHLYDTPATIAHDNQVAQDFLRQHVAPFRVWDQAGHLIPLLDSMECDREERIIRLESRWISCSCPKALCLQIMPPQDQSPVIPPTPPGSGGSSPSISSLESCPSSLDGGEDFKEEPQESNDSFWTAVSPIKQGSLSADAVEAGGREVAGQVWVRSSE
ncbi:hypothetical protein BJ322DRAFT_1109839 [Thelephora terrestris]|uniref:Uncharacterized protein n=1 Tax=Thelephora terrestris TaxID=56493 RepID=A0A9P6HC06_9AGAM|nr:hypothetical protein BJ322DRAFT_1109839 [Thelephora terrestris]